jgi:hypothetical protein
MRDIHLKAMIFRLFYVSRITHHVFRIMFYQSMILFISLMRIPKYFLAQQEPVDEILDLHNQKLTILLARVSGCVSRNDYQYRHSGWGTGGW